MRAHTKVGVILIGAALALSNVSCGGDGNSTSGDSASCGTKEIAVQAPPSAARTTLPRDDDALTSPVTETFCASFVYKLADGTTRAAPAALSSKSEATCIASGLIRELGADRVRELGLGLYGWNLLGFGLLNHGSIQLPEAQKIVGTFEKCSKDWELLMIKSVTQGTDKITDPSARCTSKELADNDARAIFAGELDRAYDEDPNAVPFGKAVQPLVAAMEKCLKPDELNELDWN